MTSQSKKMGNRADPPRPLGGISAIVVEDNWSIATGLRDMLASAGCRVIGMAGNEQSALELASSGQFDVAILDVQLGATDVRNVAATVRELEKAIVYVSGFSNLELLPANLRQYTRLNKPVDEVELVEAVLASTSARSH